MSGRRSFASSHRSHTLFALAALPALGLTLSAPSGFAQTMADPPQAPIAPAEPPVAPPAPDAPAPSSSEPAPPSQAPTVAEPTPAPTPTPATAPPPAEVAPPAASPGSSAAFAPLAGAGAGAAKSQQQPAATKPPPSARPAPAPPSPAATEVSDAAPNAGANDNGGGLLGPFRIGALVGTGLPEIVSFGGQIKLTRFFGAGVDIGIIPTVRIKYYGEAAQSYQEYDVYGHIYPFGGSFFLGAGVGYAQIDGTLVNHFKYSGYTIDVTSDATVRTMVLTPQLGFLKIFDVGFAFGFDIGAQIPIAPSQVHFNTVAVGIPPELADIIQRDYINPNDEKVRHTLDK